MRKLISWAAIIMCFSVVLSGCSNSGGNSSSDTKASSGTSSADAITLKIAHAGSEQTLMHKSLELVKEQLEDKSDGVFQVDIYPNAQLGNENELIQAVQEGDIQMMATNNGYLVNFQAENSVFSVPFAFPSEEIAYTVLDGPFGQKMLDAMEEGCGLKALGYYESVDFRQLTTNKAIHSVADLKGIKIRVMPNPIHIAIWESLGVIPSAISFGELYTALQQKTVDAQENPVELIYQSKFSEVQDYLILTNHVFSTGMAVANPDFFNGLSTELQDILLDAVTAGSDYWREQAAVNREEYYEKLEAEGMEIITLTEEAAEGFKEAVSPAVEEIADLVGWDLVNELYAAIDEAVAQQQ